jgi:hypothetical protein
MTMKRRLRSIAHPLLLAACLLALAPTLARAQNAAGEAEQLFRDGKKLMQQGNYAEACTAFETSQRLDPATTTLLNLADCREKNGQLQSAWTAFLEAERQTRGDKRQAGLNKTAKGRATKLEPRLSYLTVSVPAESNVDGLELTRDGQPFDAGLWNRAIPVDGGSYVIGGRAPGHEQWSTTATVPAEGGHISVDVPKFKVVDILIVAPEAEEPAAEEDDDELLPVEAPSPFTARRKIGLGVGGVSLVALGAGIVLGLQASDLYSDADALCPDTSCGTNASAANALSSRAHDKALVANISFGVAAAAAITAGILWFTGAPDAESAPVALAPLVTPTTAGLAVAGRF